MEADGRICGTWLRGSYNKHLPSLSIVAWNTSFCTLLLLLLLLLLSRVQLFVTPMDQSTPGPPVFHCLPELGQIQLVASMTLSNHLVLCPLLLLPSDFPNIRVFSRESSLLMGWPKYWGLSFRICPSSEHSGLISFRIDRFVLLAIQGILKSLPQHHNTKASILR